jgi:hypothetical protein
MVKTKYEDKKPAVVVSQHFSAIGIEWKVKRLDLDYMTLCQICDLEVISESR